MPLPKKRHSKTRGRKRRTHWKIKLAGLISCSHCKKPKMPHRVCPFCGYYDGKQAMEVNIKEKKKVK